MGGSFGANPYDDASEDINPNAYLTNLADCMLVLACGLMVALVVAWSVKLPNSTEITQTDNMTEVSNVEDITGQNEQGGNSYNQLGMVYQDPNTGKMYMIRDEGSTESGSTSASSTSTSSTSTTGGSMSSSQTGTSTVPKAGTTSASTDTSGQ